MTLTYAKDNRICNACNNRHDFDTYIIRFGDKLTTSICLCVNCLDELKGMLNDMQL